jgi:hypothetical protein
VENPIFLLPQAGELRVAEKNNYPIMLVFRPGYGVALTGEYAGYSPVKAPCIRTEIRRIIRILFSFPDPYILKLEFQETFDIRFGQFSVTCYRSPQKEARILELVRGRSHFMQGKTLVDAAGNLVRVLDPVSGNRLDKMIHSDSSHQDYFAEELPAILEQFLGCLQGIAFLHNNGFRHGDIRRDHIFIDRTTGVYYWIDFDYDFYLPEKPFALDLYELGNILIYLTGRGDYHLREILADPQLGPSVAESLTPDDFSLLMQTRVVNLQKLFPYIPDSLNNILLHFSSGADIFYERVEELQIDVEATLKQWGR